MLYYDRDGAPMTQAEYLLRFMDEAYQRVGLDHVHPDGGVATVTVSTVWLGLNHAIFDPLAEPLIFETLIFDWPDGEFLVRYPTLELATDGHAAITAAVAAGMDPAVAYDNVIAIDKLLRTL